MSPVREKRCSVGPNSITISVTLVLLDHPVVPWNFTSFIGFFRRPTWHFITAFWFNSISIGFGLRWCCDSFLPNCPDSFFLPPSTTHSVMVSAGNLCLCWVNVMIVAMFVCRKRINQPGTVLMYRKTTFNVGFTHLTKSYTNYSNPDPGHSALSSSLSSNFSHYSSLRCSLSTHQKAFTYKLGW